MSVAKTIKDKIKLINKFYKKYLKKNQNIAVLGLSFKPGTDDPRESPSLEIVPRLQALGAKISVFGAISAKPSAETLPTDAVRMKSRTPSGEWVRAAPEVGSTQFGPII